MVSAITSPSPVRQIVQDSHHVFFDGLKYLSFEYHLVVDPNYNFSNVLEVQKGTLLQLLTEFPKSDCDFFEIDFESEKLAFCCLGSTSQWDANDGLVELLTCIKIKCIKSFKMVLDFNRVTVLDHIPPRTSGLTGLTGPPFMGIKYQEPIARVDPWPIRPVIDLLIM